MVGHGAIPGERAEDEGHAGDAEQADGHPADLGRAAHGQVRQRADDHADGGDRDHLFGGVLSRMIADPDEQGVGERSRQPDRGGLAVTRQVQPEHLAERDERAERDRDTGTGHPVRRGLRGDEPHAGRDGEQQQARIPDLPGKPAQLVSSFGHGSQRLSITRSGALGSSWS